MDLEAEAIWVLLSTRGVGVGLEKAETKEEAKEIIKDAGMEAGMDLSDEELDQAAGGIRWPWS